MTNLTATTLRALLKEEEERLEAEWDELQEGSCNCPSGNPPCHYCVSGGSQSLEEYIKYGLEDFAHDYN